MFHIDEVDEYCTVASPVAVKPKMFVPLSSASNKVLSFAARIDKIFTSIQLDHDHEFYQQLGLQNNSVLVFCNNVINWQTVGIKLTRAVNLLEYLPFCSCTGESASESLALSFFVTKLCQKQLPVKNYLEREIWELRCGTTYLVEMRVIPLSKWR